MASDWYRWRWWIFTYQKRDRSVPDGWYDDDWKYWRHVVGRLFIRWPNPHPED